MITIDLKKPEFVRDVVAHWFKNRTIPFSLGVGAWWNNPDDSNLYVSICSSINEEVKLEKIRNWCRGFWVELKETAKEVSAYINPNYTYIHFKTKFPCKCAETERWIKKGDVAVFVPEIKKVYSKKSNTFKFA